MRPKSKKITKDVFNGRVSGTMTYYLYRRKNLDIMKNIQSTIEWLIDK